MRNAVRRRQALGYPTPAHLLNRWTAQRKADAVAQNLAGPLLRRSAFTKKIPTVSLRKSLFNSNVRSGNIPALFADLAEEYGPVFKIHPPLSKPMIFLAGTEINYWVHRHGRMYLRAKDYFSDFEKVYGTSGILPSLDGADRFRLRKAMSPAYSRGRLKGQLGSLNHHARKHMAGWTVGDSLSATSMSRLTTSFLGKEAGQTRLVALDVARLHVAVVSP